MVHVLIAPRMMDPGILGFSVRYSWEVHSSRLSLAVAAYVEVVGFIVVWSVIGANALLPLTVFVVALFRNGAELIRFLDHAFLTAGNPERKMTTNRPILEMLFGKRQH